MEIQINLDREFLQQISRNKSEQQNTEGEQSSYIMQRDEIS